MTLTRLIHSLRINDADPIDLFFYSFGHLTDSTYDFDRHSWRTFHPVKLGRNVLNEIEIIQHRVGDEYNIQFRYRD